MSTVVVFDLDDTLYPESAFIRSAFHAVGQYADEAWGRPGLGHEATKLFDAGQRLQIFQSAHLAAGHGKLTQKQADDLLRIYREHRPAKLPWFEDARLAVINMHREYRLGLISDGYLPTQANKFEALGAGAWISDPIFTESLGRSHWKPSPLAFQLMMKRYPRSNFVYVADNPGKDFVASRALGWLSVHVARPGGIYNDALSAQAGAPDISIDNMVVLEKHLRGLYG